MSYRVSLLLIVCFSIFSCQNKPAPIIESGFYYWKTNYALNPFEKNILTQLQSDYLYLRLFDIDFEKGMSRPVGLIKSIESIQIDDVEIIPTIFITQRSLNAMKNKDLSNVAENISRLITEICKEYEIIYKEIQIDCDWTAQNKDVYFKLLNELKEQPSFKNKLLSCTIRMHQVKYVVANGIPPVDKGLLMVYNMGNLTKYEAKNSIFEIKETKDYLHNIQQYHIPLDIALPLFHWSVLFKNKKFQGILYNISKDDFNDQYLNKLRDNLFEINSDVQVLNYHFKKGDELRFEEVGINELKNISKFLSPRLNNEPTRILFFHLDSFALRKHEINDLQSIMDEF